MGIQGLTKVIADNAPKAIKRNPISSYFGRVVAIDASTSIYQFLIAVRAMQGENSVGVNLANSSGETTSHLMGMFYRTIRIMENGIKPIYVFDGKPPEMKGGELAKRSERRKEAVEQAEKAKEEGDITALDKLLRRNVRVTGKHVDDCKKLLTLMGVPWLQAPGEAEAQCASLAKAGLAFAAGSEDMDTLTFGSPCLLRHLTFSEAKKEEIQEFHLEEVLQGLSMTMDQFIDLCILLGCDYCDGIRGIGPTRAVSMLKTYGNIDGILENLDREKYPVSSDWPYEQVRRLFTQPDTLIIDKNDPQFAFKWSLPDEPGLVDFMVRQNGFSEVRVRASIAKMVKARQKIPQGRLDTYFKPAPLNEDFKSTSLSKRSLDKPGPKKDFAKKSKIKSSAKKKVEQAH